MASLNVTVTADYYSVVSKLREEGKRVTEARLRRFGELAVREARDLAAKELKERDVGRSIRARTGWPTPYRDSFTFRVTRPGRNVRVELSNGHPVARIIEYGSSRHPIRPRNTKRMAWPIPQERDGPNVRFAGHVNHPGTAPYLIMRRSLETVRAQQRTQARRFYR